MLALAFLSFICAAVPCALFCVNLAQYREPPLSESPSTEISSDLELQQSELFPHLALEAQAQRLAPAPKVLQLPAVSVLIPARNEAAGIAAAISSVLTSRAVDFEIIVLDDHSTDNTAAIVAAVAERDTRVRLRRSLPLPPGWNGKQHACWQLAEAARNPILCFVDADVRLESDCLARMALFLIQGENSLVSGFPRQVTGTPLEWLLLPLIHFVLLGFLPLSRMRAGTEPGYAAGCGQFLMVDTKDYFRTGGHPAIKETMHDGLRLPRVFREHGLRTDLADLTRLAQCRMYTSAGQVWNGLAKNATEGIASPTRIGPVSALLLLGQVWPFVFLPLALFLLLLLAIFGGRANFIHPAGAALIVAAAIAAWLPRFLAVRRFQQDARSAWLHPLGVVVLIAIQWYAFIRKRLHRPVSWRDRAYPPNAVPQTAAGRSVGS